MTNFNYDPAIPNPPDDPADDVDQMQTNSASIAGIIAVNHVGFNAAGGGQHKQVAFYDNFIPVLPTPLAPTSGNRQGILFTNIQDGAAPPHTLPGNIAGLFYYSGTSAQSERQNIINNADNSGSMMLFGGLIIKWGRISFANTEQFKAVLFAAADQSSDFPNKMLSVVMSANTITPSTNGELGWNSLAVTGFTAYQHGSSPLSATYIAIGN